MASFSQHRLKALSRELARRSRASRSAKVERDLRPCVRFDDGAAELILSPHWDDAVLSCWSVLARPRDVRVVNVFAGIPPAGHAGTWEQIAGVRDSAERARLRLAEDERALSRAGREALNLPLLDEQYRRQAGARVGLAEIDGAFSQASATSASRVYAPAAIGGHADHLLVRAYARRLFAIGMPVVLYADVPYCFFHGWPGWVDGLPAQPNRDVDAYWRSFLGGVPEMPALDGAEVQRLDAASAAAKAEAVRCYEMSLNYGVRHLLADAAFSGFEVRWALVASAAPAQSPAGGSGEAASGEPLQSIRS